MKKRLVKRYILTCLLTSGILSQLLAQNTIVRGTVTDKETQLPLQNATVSFGKNRSTLTDADGNFVLEDQRNVSQMDVSYVGYRKVTLDVVRGIDQTINVELEQDSSAALGDVVVTKNKHKGYRNKDNPAVELIRQVIAHKESNRPGAYDYTQFEQYDRLEFFLSNPSEKMTDNILVKKYQFVMNNRDTTKIPGRSLLPVYLEETLSEKYLRKEPKADYTKVLGQRKVEYGPYLDNKGITAYLNFIYNDIDIYEPNIVFLTSQLQSPISDLAPTFYFFEIQDTIVNDNGEKFVQLYFTPRNNGDVLFRGTMLITTDGNYAVTNVDMSISKYININFVRSIKVLQDFEKTSDGRWHLSKSTLQTEFGLTNDKESAGVLGERFTSYKDFEINKPQPDSLYAKQDLVDPREDKPERSDSFWMANRHDTLSAAEARTYQNMDSLQNMKEFRRLMDVATLLFAGYKTYKYVEIGPVSTFFSFNPIEGKRFRFGGRTTTNFSSRWYLNGYAAYGTRDQRWKYFGSVAYSFNNKSVYEFPNNFLRFSYENDIKIPGQDLDFAAEDNFLLSFKRGVNDKYLYNKTFRIDYTKEFDNHFSYNFGFKRWEQSPTGALEFVKHTNGQTQNVNSLTTSELTLDLRFAPNETFYQSRTYRTPMTNRYPVFTFRLTQGVKGLFDGEYNYTNLHFNVFKKFYLGQFGYTHAVIDAGYVFGQLPYPLLFIHRANQTYSYQLQSYNLMNFLEFVSDHYVGLNLDHNFQGLLFNRIPVIRKLKWREVATFKILEGGVRPENNPDLHPELYDRPVDEHGNPVTFALNNQPYIEASLGIANMFRILRVDVVKRFNYLENPNVSKLGVRFRLKFDF